MRDIGLVEGDEPFKKLYTRNGIKGDSKCLSQKEIRWILKSLLINMGLTPLGLHDVYFSTRTVFEWSDTAIEGSYRFLKRIWVLVSDRKIYSKKLPKTFTKLELKLRQKSHQTLKKVTNDYAQRNSFNTAFPLWNY